MTNKLFLIGIFLFSLLLNSCGSNKHGENSIPPNVIDIKNSSFVYITDSPYKNVLIHCTNPKNKESDSCSLNTLPLIAQENKNVTKKMILQRVVTSHTWMAERFSQLLDRLDNKHMKNLFGAVTAIVIHKDIKPSFYTPETGAIYLDPTYLWLTPEEAATITVQDDFRSDFGNKLQFITGSINTLNGIPIDTNKALNSGESRTITEIEMPFAALLYHELGHANDFAPPSLIENIDKNQSVFNAIKSLSNAYISTQLYNIYPLTSLKLLSLGKVLYHGQAENDEEKELSAFVAGELFDEDRASDIYAYSDMYEDTATLFADTMMKIHYNVNNNVLFITADTHELKWGIRNPISKASVKPRALLVANRLNPIIGNWDGKFDALVGTYSYLHNKQNNKLVNNYQETATLIKHLKLLPL